MLGRVREGYARRGLAVLPPAPADNSEAVACAVKAAAARGLRTLSDLAAAPPGSSTSPTGTTAPIPPAWRAYVAPMG